MIEHAIGLPPSLRRRECGLVHEVKTRQINKSALPVRLFHAGLQHPEAQGKETGNGDIDWESDSLERASWSRTEVNACRLFMTPATSSSVPSCRYYAPHSEAITKMVAEGIRQSMT